MKSRITLATIAAAMLATGAFAQAPAPAAQEAKPAVAAPAAPAAPAAEPAKEEVKPAEQAAAPAAAPAKEEAKPAEQAAAPAAAPAKEEAKPAEQAAAPAAAPAKEEAKPAEQAATPAVEPVKEEAKPAEQVAAPAAEPAKEEAKPAEQAAAPAAEPVEEAKPAEQVANPAAQEDKGEVKDAAANALATLKASMSEGTSEAKMEVKFSGEVELDAYTDNLLEEGDMHHTYSTTVDLNIDVKFNDRWSAYVGLEADAGEDYATFGYNGAFVKYQPADFFSVTLGDITWSEGAFKSFYLYDDPAYNAAGMKEHDVRGLEISLAGLELGIGFGRGANDRGDDGDGRGNYVYETKLAYEFNYAGQHFRPYGYYKSYQEQNHNELHAGVDAGLSIGGFAFRAVYGFHADYLGDDDGTNTAFGAVDATSTAHTILAEPTFEVSIFKINTAVFFAFTDGAEDGRIEYDEDEIPEYFFLYGEPAFKFAEFITVGIPLEFHTNTLDEDEDVSTFDVGARVYISPVENLEIMAFGMVDIPVGDDAPDTGLRFGIESVFNF